MNQNPQKHKKKRKNLRINKLEKQLFQEGYKSIIGIDEVGRGCMAGPMVVAGFKIYLDDKRINGVNDSKILNRNQREAVYPKLIKSTHHIYEIGPEDIDANGLTITFKRAVFDIHEKLGEDDSIIIVDGNLRIGGIKNIQSVIDADAHVYPVAAASIIAKVYRDNLMYKYGKIYPQYGFEDHVGYATKKHRDAVTEHGIIEIHRKSYSFIRRIINPEDGQISLLSSNV